MKFLLSRLSLRCTAPVPHRTASHFGFNTQRSNMHKHSQATASGDSSLEAPSLLDMHPPELPEAPRYPCPFITTSDIERYLVPLYRTGWGISHAPVDGTKARVHATRLSKRIMFSNPDIARVFMTDVVNHITDPENHHPVWGAETNLSGIHEVHIHTHTALAPAGRQNAGDQGVVKQKRAGITLRDIRWAVLFEGLLRDYMYQGLLERRLHMAFPQPTDIDSVHNFRVLPSQP